MIRRPPRSTQGVSSAASDVYKRQVSTQSTWDDKSNEFKVALLKFGLENPPESLKVFQLEELREIINYAEKSIFFHYALLLHALNHRQEAVSYTHLRAHETSLHLVCRLLLEKKKKTTIHSHQLTDPSLQ
eukprot:TRINITY_DN30378_c0_g1_i2.p1 TRINITY_DN30378_c0_g1~~TRINITY_DN30378_c0_g1_i2.p1  ORF type:complete len:130 (-),score=44.46 TRINITY_DN30378_c0_g1_i2:29-418(-)